MNSSASFRQLGMILMSLGLLAIASSTAANTVISSQPIDINTTFAAADEQGRFVYLVEYAEPGLMQLQRQLRAPGQLLDMSTPATRAALSNIQAAHRNHLQAIAGSIHRNPEVSHYFLATHSGMAMRLTPQEAQRMAELPQVLAIERERVYELSTFRSPQFIGADTIWSGASVPAGSPLQGEGMVAAILDTGVDPNHPSFANDPACGHGVGNVPDKLLSFLDCQSTDTAGLCNGPSPQDNHSHGSHVASTVAGNRLDNSTVPSPNVPPPFTEISGVAPCAHIRSYHVCQPGFCPGADILAGMNSVLIHGDVDVMNFSISGGTNPWLDTNRRKLDLVDAGVFVAASAGNTTAATPDPVSQVNHLGPWVATIAASTYDAITANLLSVAGGPQDVLGLQGSGPAMTADFTGQLRYAGDVVPANFQGCNPFPANAFDDEAALISRGGCAFVVKVNNAVNAGATFVVVFNNVAGAPFVMDGLEDTTVSSVMVTQAVGQASITALSGATAGVFVAAELSAVLEPALGDNLAGFSLRGPTPAPLQNLQKPDLTAPGVNIWAASIQPGGYQFMSGTSMSSPHVAGAALLVSQANPGWTPSEVKSALMMTAFTGGHKADGVTPWDTDDVGSGRVDLTLAALAGLVMDETLQNYLDANPAIGGDVTTLNLAAVRNVNCTPSCSWQRTLRNTLDVPSAWTVTADSGNPNLVLQVSPSSFAFTGGTGETVTLTITATPQADLTAAIEFGEIVLIEGTDQAPPARLTSAISGTNLEPPQAAVDATELVLLVEENGAASQTFNISNLGAAGLSEDLIYTIDEAQPFSVVLGEGPMEPIELIIDTGIATIIGVDNQQILWFNQFTPGVLDIPFTLEEVDIAFAPGDAGVAAGDLFDVHVWVDPDRDPTNGATLVASVTGQAVSAGVNFQTVTLPPGIKIDAGSGDVLIGVVNRRTAALYRPALADSPGNSQQRSWIAFNFPGGTAGDPPVFGDAATFGLIDAFLPGRNWTIRGFGTGGSACLAPSDVPWLTVTPTSGSVAGGASEQIQVDVNMTGLGQGEFEARLCIATNDPENPIFVLPVSVIAVGPGGLPTIDVTPASLGFNVDIFDAGASQNLDIANTGNNLALEWFIEQAEGAIQTIIPAGQIRNTGGGTMLGTLDGRVSLSAPDVCDAPSDISWLDVSPSSGTTAALSTTPVSVSVDASGLEHGLYTATLCVRSNDPSNPLVEVPVTLEVTQNSGVLDVSPIALAFGEVDLGDDATLSFTVSNVAAAGAATLELATLGLSGDAEFAITGGDCTVGTELAPGEDCSVELTFTPSAAATFSGQLEVVTTDAQSAIVTLSGEGVLRPDELFWDRFEGAN